MRNNRSLYKMISDMQEDLKTFKIINGILCALVILLTLFIMAE